MSKLLLIKYLWIVFVIAISGTIVSIYIKKYKFCSKEKLLDNPKDSLPAIEYLSRDSLLSTVVSLKDALDFKQCSNVLAALDRNEIELTNDRHINYPTRDIPTYRLPCLEVETGKVFNRLIRPTISSVWGVDPDHLVLIDEFLVEYDAEGRSHLDEHIDGHTFSYIIQVNELDNFIGGGTRFSDTSQVFQADPRGVIIFCGRRKHQGLQISRGRRVIITGFVDISFTKDEEYRFQSLLVDLNAKERAFSSDRIPNLHLYPNLSRILDENMVHESDIIDVLTSGRKLDNTALKPPSRDWASKIIGNKNLIPQAMTLYKHIEGHISNRDLMVCIAGNILRIVTNESECEKYPELCFNKPYLT